MSPYFFIKRRKQPFNYWQNHLPNSKLFSLALSFFHWQESQHWQIPMGPGLVCVIWKVLVGTAECFFMMTAVSPSGKPAPKSMMGHFQVQGGGYRKAHIRGQAPSPIDSARASRRAVSRLVCGLADQPLQRFACPQCNQSTPSTKGASGGSVWYTDTGKSAGENTVPAKRL